MWRVPFLAVLALWFGSAVALEGVHLFVSIFSRYHVFCGRRGHAHFELAHGWWLLDILGQFLVACAALCIVV
jgi:hypothetical protein